MNLTARTPFFCTVGVWSCGVMTVSGAVSNCCMRCAAAWSSQVRIGASIASLRLLGWLLIPAPLTQAQPPFAGVRVAVSSVCTRQWTFLSRSRRSSVGEI